MKSLIGKFKLPNFQEEKGSDWQPFKDIISNEEDYLKESINNLYKKRNVSTMQFPYINYELERWDIEYNDSDTIQTKKSLRRDMNRRYAQKGLADIYLSIQEGVVGIRGAFYTFSEIEGITDKYILNNHLFLDIKTNDPLKATQILDLFRKKEIQPGFYQIYLIYWNGSTWELIDTLTDASDIFIVDR